MDRARHHLNAALRTRNPISISGLLALCYHYITVIQHYQVTSKVIGLGSKPYVEVPRTTNGAGELASKSILLTNRVGV
jgi:hypothetical protein